MEKQACAVDKAFRKWKQLLLGKSFTLITDQRSVSFMLNMRHPSKLENDKIQRWQLELAAFNFTIIYRPGKLKFAPDTLSRVIFASVAIPSLKLLTNLHESMCHPGIILLAHYVKVKSLPFLLNDVKNVTQACKNFSKVKASFLKPEDKINLIKATQLFERISINFKKPLLSFSKNRYLLVIVDEFSRFPFAYAYHNMKSTTVIKKLTYLFSIFGFFSNIYT